MDPPSTPAPVGLRGRMLEHALPGARSSGTGREPANVVPLRADEPTRLRPEHEMLRVERELSALLAEAEAHGATISEPPRSLRGEALARALAEAGR